MDNKGILFVIIIIIISSCVNLQRRLRWINGRHYDPSFIKSSHMFHCLILYLYIFPLCTQKFLQCFLQENGIGKSNGKSLLDAIIKLSRAINDELTSLAENEKQVTGHAQKTEQKLSAVCVWMNSVK